MTVTDLRPRPQACVAPKTGLTGYKEHRCRCAGCTAASTAYQARRGRLLAYGRWEPLVDAEPVREHLRTLSANGIGARRVAELTRISSGGLNRILYGGEGRPPCRRVKSEIAQAILAIKPTAEALSDGALVDGTSTRRRIQGMAAIGWPLSDQGRRCGRDPRNYTYLLNAEQVTVKTARMVRELYDALSAVAPPPGRLTNRTRAWAARKGYAPPLAWDDDTIDDPAAQPDLGTADDTDTVDEVAIERALAGDAVPLNRPEQLRAIEHGIRRGMAQTEIAGALTINTRTVNRIAAQLRTQQAA